MTAATETARAMPAAPTRSGFERYLSLWVFLCIVAGVACGQALPGVFQAIGRMEVQAVE